MKRPVILILFMLVDFIVTAQDTLTYNRFISLNAGRSFPVGIFASTNSDRLNAGLAKNGFDLEMKYAHQFDDVFGFSSAFVYARYPIKKLPVNENSGASIKPCEYYELLIGPMITGSIAPKIYMDISALSGMAFISATKINLNGRVIEKKYTASSVPLKFAVDFRFDLTHNFYFFTGINYNHQRANFNVTVESQELSFKQSMNTVGINAGAGFRLY